MDFASLLDARLIYQHIWTKKDKKWRVSQSQVSEDIIVSHLDMYWSKFQWKNAVSHSDFWKILIFKISLPKNFVKMAEGIRANWSDLQTFLFRGLRWS